MHPLRIRTIRQLTRARLLTTGAACVCLACFGSARPLVPHEENRPAAALAPDAKIDPAVKSAIDSGKNDTGDSTGS
jgi:hypothetical protein